MGLPLRQQDAKHDVLKAVFGFDSFRPGQEQAIDALLAGRHLLAVMPTGSGKSLCYQVPALVLGGLTIVVSPLVALMQDQVAALRLAGVAAETINSSRSREDNVAAWRRAVAGEVRLLYMAPERLMTERMLDALAKLDVRLVAIDEAHCISQWGPAFRPEYRALAKLAQRFPAVPMIALTATADEVTRADIALQLFDNRALVIVQGFDRPNIALAVESKSNTSRQLLDFIARHKDESGIVYCLSRNKTEETARLLVEHGIVALPYHAGLDKSVREANQNRFMTEPAVVMVATIAFGMGIDKSDVRFVFHTDLPGSLEAYYQEFGRAGRDGAPAEARMLFGLQDIRMRRVFIDREEAGEERKRREHARLNMLLAYCEASRCRRQLLLSYFGEASQPCGNCDLCREPRVRIDRTDDARKVLAAVRATGERFGAVRVIEALGETDRKHEDWRGLIRQMVGGGVLRHDAEGFGSLHITPEGHALLRGETRFECRPVAAKPRTKRETRSERFAGQPGDSRVLIASLKALRLQLARERRVPPYVIFSDRSLIDMAEHRPADERAFGEIHGVGAAKLKEFAAIFLRAIKEHETVSGDGET
ncbi:MAG: DNA helicase RecQ [Alphaproteobacteria bacterium]|nr:DNA helicase RecQ [Alphaproteobacteria bacterium]MBV9694162.1 DNA helicase RecQ [Alphaproteobacteria bacterium]